MTRIRQALEARAVRRRAVGDVRGHDDAFHLDAAPPVQPSEHELVDENGYIVETTPPAKELRANPERGRAAPHRISIARSRAKRAARKTAAQLGRVVWWPIGATGVYCYDSFLRTGYIRTAVNTHGYHWAQDFSSRRTSAGFVSITGCRVYTPVNGTINQAGWNSYWGWFFTVLAPDGDIWLCAHLRYRPLVRAGQRITTRTRAGYVGASGNATGPHLHIEHWLGRVRDNPRAPHRYDTFPSHYNATFRQVA